MVFPLRHEIYFESRQDFFIFFPAVNVLFVVLTGISGVCLKTCLKNSVLVQDIEADPKQHQAASYFCPGSNP